MPVRSATLAVGQDHIWAQHEQAGPDGRAEMNIVSTLELPDGVGHGTLAAALDHLVRRHEGLRTTYHDTGSGGVRQRVHPPAAPPLGTVTVERDGTESPARAAERLGAAFDHTAEWPLRACVITQGGLPRRLLFVVSHVAVDDWSVQRLRAEFTAILDGLRAGRPAVLDPVADQPVDLARHESSPAETAARARTRDAWAAALRRVPSDAFATRRPHPAPAAGTGASSTTLTSPAALDAVATLAARHRLWTSAVHGAAYAALVAAYTGAGTVAYRSFTANRGDPRRAGVLACLFSPVPVVVDAEDDPSFAELLARTGTALSEAHERTPAGERAWTRLLAEESDRRGEPVAVRCEVNHLRRPDESCGARRTTVTANAAPHAWAERGEDLYFRVYERGDGITAVLHAAAAVMGAPCAGTFLRAYEHTVLGAAAGASPRVSELAEVFADVCS